MSYMNIAQTLLELTELLAAEKLGSVNGFS
jgi:hypothetical protein